MEKKIGKVTLDYEFYNPNMHYSDGKIEDTILEAAKNNKIEELLYSSNEWAVLYHCSDMRENILEWYPFKEGASLLEVGSGCGALTGLFSQKVTSVTCIELSERRSLINAYRNQNCENVKILLGNFEDIELREKFDYVTLIGVFEYAGSYVGGKDPYMNMLRKLKQYLKEDGILFIAIENKMGIKYWNGAVEDHIGKMYGGLNDYVDDGNGVRTFSQPELENMIREVGWKNYRFYYPMPDYKLPTTIYSDKRLPQPGELRNYKCDFSAFRVYNFYDATVCDQLCQDRVFPYFSNSFLIECGHTSEKVLYVKYNRERKKEYTIATQIINEEGSYTVLKRALTTGAGKHIEKLSCPVESHGMNLSYVKGHLEKGVYKTEYIEGKDLDVEFYQYRNDAELFVEKVKEAINLYISPDDTKMIDFEVTDEYRQVFGEHYIKEGRCLKATNVDMIFSNLRLDQNGRIFCIDNEWTYDFPIPYEFVIWRAASQLYTKYMIYLKNKISRKEYIAAVGVNADNLEIYQEMEKMFRKNSSGRQYLSNYKKQSMMCNMRFL